MTGKGHRQVRDHLEGCGGMNLCRSNAICQGWRSRSQKDSCPKVEARRWMGPQAGVKWGEDPTRRISRPHVRADSMPTMPARQPAGEPLLRMVRHLLES